MTVIPASDLSIDDASAHYELQTLRARLQGIYTSIAQFQPLTAKPPILDSSLDLGDSTEDSQWLQQENVPGLKNLRDAIKRDLDVLEKVGQFPQYNLQNLLTSVHLVVFC